MGRLQVKLLVPVSGRDQNVDWVSQPGIGRYDVVSPLAMMSKLRHSIRSDVGGNPVCRIQSFSLLILFLSLAFAYEGDLYNDVHLESSVESSRIGIGAQRRQRKFCSRSK